MDKGKRSPEDRAARSRLNYIKHRLDELKHEMERLKSERQTLRMKIGVTKSPAPANKS